MIRIYVVTASLGFSQGDTARIYVVTASLGFNQGDTDLRGDCLFGIQSG